MKWYLPSFGGDFRLEPHDSDPTQCQLVLVQPTAHECQMLNGFLVTARKKGWGEVEPVDLSDERRTIVLTGPMAKVAPVLVKATRPVDRTITAVTFKDGHVEVAEGSQSRELMDLAERATAAAAPTTAEDAAGTAAKTDPSAGKAATSVARPTPSCPDCAPGAIAPATEVLLAFLTPAQHADWSQYRAIVVEGGTTGHRYLLAHRHSAQATKQGRICMDLDDDIVVHFHDWSVPPEEEVLGAKLILEHREAWLRNEATLWDHPDAFRFKNPFGDRMDGVADAQFSERVGSLLLKGLGYRS